MIEKIQNLIEDSTSLEVTGKQVQMFLAIIGALFFLVVFMMMKSGGPSKNDKSYVPAPPNPNAPTHISGQGTK
ncbi:MAG: hypothetical protein ACKUBY_04475 [Candidatus Moraniibacteriota bacterium]|jgi:hypothetical protein